MRPERGGTARPHTILYLHGSAGRYGADRQLRTIVAGLDRSAFRARVVIAEDGPLAGDLRDVGAQVSIRPLAVLRRELLSPTGLARTAAAWAADAGRLGREARVEGVALVHSNTSAVLAGGAVARVAGIPHVQHVREIYAGFERWWPAYRRMLLRADALPCVSEPVRSQFDGAPHADRATVLPDGLDPSAPAPSRDAARRTLGLRPDAYVVAVLGRLSAWKGQELVVEALAAPALRDDRRTVALLAGSAWREDPGIARGLRERAESLGVAERVLLPGFVEPVADVYAAADVVAVPSTRPDPLPNSALEAAAAGCCVVAADHGGLRGILDDGRTGVLIAPGDAALLAGALAALRDDPDRRARLGALARDDVRERYGADRLADRIQDLYAGLIRARERGAPDGRYTPTAPQ